MIHAAALGVVLTLIDAEPEEHDPALSEATREAIFAAITMDETDEMNWHLHSVCRGRRMGTIAASRGHIVSGRSTSD